MTGSTLRFTFSELDWGARQIRFTLVQLALNGTAVTLLLSEAGRLLWTDWPRLARRTGVPTDPAVLEEFVVGDNVRVVDTTLRV